MKTAGRKDSHADAQSYADAHMFLRQLGRAKRLMSDDTYKQLKRMALTGEIDGAERVLKRICQESF